MSLVYNSNKFQYAVSQSLPFGEVRRGFPFNAFNCMKAYSYNGERYGYYGYDASGERTYKMGFDKLAITTNQGGIDSTYISWVAGNLMLYPNGYMNINQNGEYTKHYYADALRIASKIGSGKSGLDLCSEAMAIENAYPDYLTDRINEQYEQMKEELWELVPGSEYIVDITPIPYPNFCDIGPGGQESALFFYHPDHLGSTGMITDNSANITQGFLYTPFGEIISDYSPTFHDSPMPNYAFNAKELDEENGMYYYSARYYAPPTFISRDPMFEKYPSISPYSYCANNPLNRVDPTGLDWEKPEDQAKANELIHKANNQIKSNDRFINRLEKQINKMEQKGNTEGIDSKKGLISEMKERNTLLEDGIKGLEEMGKVEQKFAFKEVFKENGANYYSVKRDDGVIDIEYNNLGIAWHESMHNVNALRNPSNYGFDANNILSIRGGANALNSEHINVYKSHFSFSPSDLIFSGYGASSLKDINQGWMKKAGVWAY